MSLSRWSRDIIGYTHEALDNLSKVSLNRSEGTKPQDGGTGNLTGVDSEENGI
jgi:hypothetical protein